MTGRLWIGGLLLTAVVMVGPILHADEAALQARRRFVQDGDATRLATGLAGVPVRSADDITDLRLAHCPR
ncbi:MAG: hypothetical protein ACYTG6_18280 [Planctomycetota bacterium]